MRGGKRSGKVLLWMMVLSLGIQGCASKYSVVEFEVLEPATVNFPDQVNQLIFMNRAPISIDIWSEQNQEGMEAAQLIVLDTLIVNNLFRGVLEVLRNSPIDKFHYPIWLSDRRLDTAFLDDKILTKREVQELCDSMKGDAVISLELYTVSYEQHYNFYTDAPDQIQNHYFEVSNRLKWNIHLPGSPRPFDTYTMADTLYFPRILNGEMQGITPGVDMLRDLFYESGFKYGSYLVPVWNITSRILFKKGDDSLRSAVKQTDNGNWEDAFSIWNGLTGSDDSLLVAKAYHNMAVYYELEDKLDSAGLMLDLALEHDSLEQVRLYREEIEVRLLNRKDIEDQIRNP